MDARFQLEAFVDDVIAAEAEHPNTELFNRAFDLLDVLRNDHSLESYHKVENDNAQPNGAQGRQQNLNQKRRNTEMIPKGLFKGGLNMQKSIISMLEKHK